MAETRTEVVARARAALRALTPAERASLHGEFPCPHRALVDGTVEVARRSPTAVALGILGIGLGLAADRSARRAAGHCGGPACQTSTPALACACGCDGCAELRRKSASRALPAATLEDLLKKPPGEGGA